MNIEFGRRRFLGTGLAMLASSACTARPASVWNVSDFGALGDGSTDDAPAFQRAIDAAAAAGGGVVRFGPGTHLMRYRVAADGVGATCFELRSGIVLEGEDRERSILRLADRQRGPGTFARLIGSKGTLTGAGLRNFTIDANRDGQAEFSDDSNGGAIVLGWAGRCENVEVTEVNVRNANGQGIMLLGAYGDPATGLRIANNLVERSSYIGIQSSQFDGLEITGNTVRNCTDNGIDIYGNDDVGHSTVVTSHNALIRANTIRGCGIGIFLETVADCRTIDNTVTGCRLAGLRVNRINGEPRNILIARNAFTNSPFGVAIGGDTGGVRIAENAIEGFTVAGVQFTYNVSRIEVVDNRFLPAGNTVPIVLAEPIEPDRDPSEQLSFVTIGANHIPEGHHRDALFVNRYKRQFMVDAGGLLAGR